ncbi:MAG: sigma-54 interaction domain-containing protein [Desulfobulbaceae bacterium]
MKSEPPDPLPTSPAALFRLDHEGRIIEVNRQAETLTGKSADHLRGRTIGETFPGHGEFADLLARCEQLRAGNAISVLTFLLADRRGDNPKHLLATLLPLPAPGHATEGTLLCLSEAIEPFYHQRLALNSMADGVFTVDRNWTITSFNRAAERITGWPATQAIGRRCGEVFNASICGKSCAIAESLYTGRAVANRSITIRGREGETIPVSISASPLADSDGNIIGGVETFRDLTALTGMRSQLPRKHSFDQMVSNSKAMQRLFAILPEVAASPSIVLISGESGTGKELVARALYHSSDRNTMPYIAVNCGALPEALLESELFGYKAGAFTDARKDKEGRFAAAEGGVLFLDEIGDVPQSIQVKLLRILQEKVYEPLGSNTPVQTNVRIITATNRNLQDMVNEGKFREDLYYRLNVVRIHLPPLRERKEDIPLLADQLIKEFSAQQAKDIVGIAASALNILMHHDFPGNIRELKNIIEYAFILCDGAYIMPQHLPDPFNTMPHLPESEQESGLERPRTLEEIERQAIFLALEKNKWKKSATCEELGISKDTLRRKLGKYNLNQPFMDDLPGED